MLALPRSALALLAGLSVAGVSAAESLEEMQACLAANKPPSTVALELKLVSRGPADWTTTHQAKLYWKRSKEGFSQTLVCMSAPRDVRGLAYLVHERPDGQMVWVYLPEEERVVTMNPGSAARRGHIARTAVSYDDLRYLPMNLAQAAPDQTLTETLIGDRKVFQVELALPSGSRPAYEKVVGFVDQERCVPLKTEFYEAGNKLRKVVNVDPGSITQEGPIRVARSLRVRDLKRKVETDLTVEKIQLDADFSDDMFTPQSPQFRRGRCAD
jgi:outer membrane lipoprotein-sorting protein